MGKKVKTEVKKDWYCKCEHCDKFFMVVLKWSKYCNIKCRMAAYRKAKKLREQNNF